MFKSLTLSMSYNFNVTIWDEQNHFLSAPALRKSAWLRKSAQRLKLLKVTYRKALREIKSFILSFIDLRFIFHIIAASPSVTFTLSCISTQTCAVLNWKISTVDRFHLHLNQSEENQELYFWIKICLSVSTPRLSHHIPPLFLPLPPCDWMCFLSHIENGLNSEET